MGLSLPLGEQNHRTTAIVQHASGRDFLPVESIFVSTEIWHTLLLPGFAKQRSSKLFLSQVPQLP